MKKLIAAILISAACLTVQAEKIMLPLELTARATDTVTTNLMELTPTVTNWASLHGITVAASNGCSATVSLFETVGNATNMFHSSLVTATSAGYRLHMLMPRKGVWPDINPAVDKYPIIGTNCFLSLKQTSGLSTNTYFIQILVD